MFKMSKIMTVLVLLLAFLTVIACVPAEENTPGINSIKVELVSGAATVTPTVTATPSPTPTGTATPTPTPAAGFGIKISIKESNFNLVAKLGQNNVTGEGHVHYFLDVMPPVTQGEPAIPPIGEWVATADNSYTFTNVAPGVHVVSVELVNNDHTPLSPPVLAAATITVPQAVTPEHFPLISGWYKGSEVRYYDFGSNTPLVDGNPQTAPIYVFVYGINTDGSPDLVPGQYNIVGVVPGDPGYSDLWQVNLVTVPQNYQADSIRSVSEVMNGNFTVEETDMFVNCPIVPAGSTLEDNKTLTQGWYNGGPIYYFDFGPNPDIAAPIYVLITGMDAQGNPQFVPEQRNIIDVVPGDENYTAFWQVNLVTVPQDYVANTLRSVEGVLSSGYPTTVTDNLVNCPVYEAPSPTPTPTPTPSPTPTPTPTPSPSPTPTLSPTPTATPSPTTTTVDLTAQNMAFNTSTISVPAGAEVTVNFNNMDSGIPHNFAVYTNSSATTPIFVGGIITGPSSTTYTFTAPTTPGNYFFRCDVHPTTMTGTFTVTGS